MSDNDALLALRQAVKSKETITFAKDGQSCQTLLDATHLVLSSTCTLHKSTPTRYRRPAAQDFFTLEALYLAWQLQNASGADYMKQARDSGLAVGFVSVTERKNVVDWLEGRTTENERIVPLTDTNTPPGTPPPSTKPLPATPHRANAVASTSTSVKRRYVPDARDAEAVKKIKQHEVELRDRNSVLRGGKPNNFSNIRLAYADKLKKMKEASRSGSSAATAPEARSVVRKPRNNFPIIMISSSPTALITMHNVKKFLQESTFEPSQDARQRAMSEGNSRPEDMIAIYRKRTTIDTSGKEHESHVRYFIVDSVEALGKFGPDAWERVVCVMTTGQAWQFRPYKWNEPIQLFHHVKGIYFSWSNDPPNPKIKDWNVTELKIDPMRRHVDKSVVAHFWKILDTWTTANKPGLMSG
ncbi:CDC73-C domain-containing protein [Mycena indigotica]|uniref:CDC73-C domain-containing protein n=1 Tax=Mycena indigotica TaxID=2126181 RepID=A0A8H6W243_9AGAR|nr:CDC73-C domain-containing protein [Mycena indigotica]KAF7298863.1 CDC73-C domain-containing protein [Mycena indigotica]